MSASLADLQSKFQARLMSGAKDIDTHLGGGGPFMGVYDFAYKARLVEILQADFEGLHTLLGDEKFDEASRAYLDAHPSTFRSARWVGGALSDWLAKTQPWSGIPEAVAMARFEWALGLAFDAVDAATVGFDEIAKVPPEAWPLLTLTIHPSVSVVDLTHDVAPFHHAVKAQEDPEGAPEPFATPETLVAWRDADALQAMYRALEADEAAMLRAAMDGRAFDFLCEVVAQHGAPDQAAMRAAGLLRLWIESGWIIGVDADGMSW